MTLIPLRNQGNRSHRPPVHANRQPGDLYLWFISRLYPAMFCPKLPSKRSAATMKSCLVLALAWAHLSLGAPAPQGNAPPQNSIPPTAAAPTRPIPEFPHGPFTGTLTVTGALSASVLASSIAPKPPSPTVSGYPSNGQLNEPMPAPHMPAVGLETGDWGRMERSRCTMLEVILIISLW